MTTSTTTKTFDCVENMRRSRERLSEEIEDMSHEDLARWIRGHEFKDLSLKRIARRAAPSP